MEQPLNLDTIRGFFDRCAPTWDDLAEYNGEIISQIFDHAGITAGQDVLDVACGTGILFPDYERRQVRSLTAIDLSPEMARRAAEKLPTAQVLCGDAAHLDFGKTFDAIMIYNAFPHFPQPDQLLRNLKKYLRPGGTLTVAHGMSREAIQQHHASHASAVSVDLPSIEEMTGLFSQYFTVEYSISNDILYEIVGRNC